MVYQRMLIIFTIVQSNWHPPAAEQARWNTHSHPSCLTHQGSDFLSSKMHILNKYQSLQCTCYLWKHQEAEAGFTAHGNTLLLFFHSTLKWMELPKQHIQKVWPRRGDAQNLLLPGGTFQVFTCSKARTDTPPSIRLWEVLCLSGQLEYSFNWATAPHQNLAHLYMTCIPESLWEALQINLAVYIQTSPQWLGEKQLVIPHCSEFHRSPNKPKTHKCWDPNTVLWQPHSNIE